MHQTWLRCRSHYGDLAVHSEAELDAALAAIDHKLHHETVPLAMEKRLIADHKKLSQQREKVRRLCVSAVHCPSDACLQYCAWC